MSLNKFMHPRNIYKSPPNFKELCQQYPEFLQYASQKPNNKGFDFKNPEALRCLTLILLKKDFGLNLKIPENTLIPTLPLRLNYILWVEDLLNWSPESEASIEGIDIGTGATCIYPLLAAKKNSWKMLATEINECSVQIAIENVKNNSLEHLISVVQVSDSTYLKGVVTENKKYDFCMCNPPFFNIDHSTNRRRSDSDNSTNDQPPAGSTNEISSVGGEIEFIKRIMRDSSILRDQIRIFTTMVGHKSSLQPLLEELKGLDVLSISQTEFCQGRTVRWAIAWTFAEQSLKVFAPLSESKLPKPITWLLDSKYNFKECAEVIIPRLLSQLKMKFLLLEDYKKRKLWRITAYENTWTGLRKKRREQHRNKPTNDDDNAEKIVSEDNSRSNMSQNADDLFRNSLNLDVKQQKVKESCPKTNYCRLYALNEKRKADSADDVPSKKSKTDNDDIPESTDHECVIKALFHIKNVNGKIELQILYESGKKDAPQQILQFFKNNLNE